MPSTPRPQSAPKLSRPELPRPVQVVVPTSSRLPTPPKRRLRSIVKSFSKDVRRSVPPDKSRPPFDEGPDNLNESDGEHSKERKDTRRGRYAGVLTPDKLYQTVAVDRDDNLLVRDRKCFVESFPRADFGRPIERPPDPYPYTNSRRGPWRRIRVEGPLPRGQLPLTALRGKEEDVRRMAFQMDVELHRISTRRTQMKMVAFDQRRRTMRLHQHMVRMKKVEEPPTPMDKTAQAKAIEVEGVAAELGTLFEELDTGGMPSQTEVPFKVVKVSSQDPGSAAPELYLGSSSWETEVGHVKQEYVVFELDPEDKCAIDMISLRLPGNDCNPRTCQVSYSTTSANGPFQDGWTFQIPSKATTSHRSSHTYVEEHRHVEDFAATLREAAEMELETDDLVQAWCAFMEVDMDTDLAYGQFVQCIHKFLGDYDVENPIWLFDLPHLFKCLDSDETGFVSSSNIARVHSREGVAPEARWWKLNILQNFGGKRINILGPLKLTRSLQANGPCNAKAGGSGSRGSVNRKESLGNFTLQAELEVDAESAHVRELSRLHELPLIDVEALHFKFKLFQHGQDQNLKESQFKALVCDLFGARDQWDIPAQRLQFFWQQADAGRRLEVNFEDLVIWFRKYAGDVDLRKMRKSARI